MCQKRSKGKHRDKFSIVTRILEVIDDRSKGGQGINKTRIKIEVSLSHYVLMGYLRLLVSNTLIEYNQLNHTYQLTQKGYKFLKLYREMKRILDGNELAHPTSG